MIARIVAAYAAELLKALRTPFTYVGPVIVVLTVLCTLLMEPVRRDSVGDYDFIARATPMALNVAGLFLTLIYCAGLIASETGSGTIRLVLVRPIRRREFLAAKLMMGWTYAFGLTLLTAGAAWGVVLAFGDLTGIDYGGSVLYAPGDMRDAYLVGMALSLAPQMAVVGYAVMISTLTRNAGAAIGSAVGIWLLVDVVKHPLRIGSYLFSSYIETPWQVFINQSEALDTAWYPDALMCALTSGISLCLFVAVAGYVLHRGNLHA